MGNVEQDGFGGPKKSLDVFPEFEDPIVVHPNPFKDTVAVKEAVIEHAHLGIGFVEVFPVNVHLHAHDLTNYGTETAGRKGMGGLENGHTSVFGRVKSA